MSWPPEKPLDLESVTLPPESPSPEPDPQTSLEELDQSRMRNLKEMSKSAALHRTIISEREIQRLADECSSLRQECRLLHERLHGLAPRYASLRKAYDDLKNALGGSTLTMFVGGVAVSIAGAWETGMVKVGILCVGITASFCGLIWGTWSLLQSGNADHASRSGDAGLSSSFDPQSAPTSPTSSPTSPG